ncbi:hypothetical protein ACFSM5_07645 [Lacibacterium aquatile]|uniref:DUF1835 domain-containing protein n=1 Tax=Lacibacterium aquatile TaxID=1168082 RepID=A0ABW5DQD2_9PROT
MTERILHIRCGDDLRAKLPDAGIVGDYLKWCDPLCDGPTPLEVPNDDWYSFRAKWISARYGDVLAAVMGDLMQQDQGLFEARLYDKVVIWSEHDLFDQSILARLLAHFAERPHPGLHLIDHPDYLGSLEPGTLANLYVKAQPVTDQQLRLGHLVWDAWRDPSPRALAEIANSEQQVLPNLQGALRRHLANLPGVTDGLSMTERLALQAIADGATTASEIFKSVGRAEPALWLGDTMFFPILDDLAQGPLSLLEKRGGTYKLSPVGGAVVMGQADATRFLGRERWVGGVQLSPVPEWRWDERTLRLVAAG